MTKSLDIKLTIIASVLLLGPVALAALGEKSDSVEADRIFFNGTKTSTVSPQFTVHEITAGKTQIREYESPTGTIFGVAWSGPLHPNISRLLNTYDEKFNSLASQNLQKGHQPQILVSANLHVERQGHMRALKKGRAFDPKLIPAGVSTEVIR